MVPYSHAVQLHPRDVSVYSVEFSEDWYQGRGVYGGLQFAMMARALEEAAGPDREIRSFSAECCTPPRAGEGVVRVLPLRTGRTVSQLAAEILQDGESVSFATATLGGPRDSSHDFDESTPPYAGEGLELANGTLPPPFTQHFQYYFCYGEPPMSGAMLAETGCRVRLHHPPARWSAPLVLAYVDAIWPAILPLMTHMPVMGTVSFHAHLRGDYSDVEAGPEAPALLIARSQHTRQGYSSQENVLWSADGKLLCRSLQLVAIIR